MPQEESSAAKTMESVVAYFKANQTERHTARHVVASGQLKHVERIDHMAIGYLKFRLLGMLAIAYAVWLLGLITFPFPHLSYTIAETVIYVLAIATSLWIAWRKQSQKLRRLLLERTL